MHVRRVLALASAAWLLGIVSAAAQAQNAAPFTIRFPPDGATVREKVDVKIPLASIPDGGYVAIYVDGMFRVALTPNDADKPDAKPESFFVYTWDTKVPMRVKGSPKEEVPKDGSHEIAANLYNSGGTLQQTTSITINVANKITADVGDLTLRYHFLDGADHAYSRSGTAVIVAGLSQTVRGTGEQEIGAENSDLQLSIMDVYPNRNAIVRNQLKRLTIRQNGQETTYPENVLPRALFQEVTPLGTVVYQNQNVTFDQFAALGVPVEATLELPPLPRDSVKIGDTWQTPNVKLDIPGMAPDKQPKVTLENKLEDLEWEGGYQTAKIVQRYDSSKGGFKEKSIMFGAIDVNNPQVNFERQIFIAYRSGALVKIIRKLEVTGKTSQMSSGAGTIGGSGMMSSPPMMGGMSGSIPMPPGAGYGSSMSGPPLAMGGGRVPGMMGGMGPNSMMLGGKGGGASGMRAMSPGMSPMGSGGYSGPMIGSGGYSGPMVGGGGYTGPMMGGSGGMMGGGASGMSQLQISLKSTTVTELKPTGKKAQ